MDNIQAKEKITQDLLMLERAETDMIYLYETILASGVDKCLPPDKYKIFSETISIIHDESEKHSNLIFNMIEKFKTLD
jgi:hypothetical protein